MTRKDVNRDRYVLADKLHSAAIHLLRRARRVDEETGLSASRLSALSVLVFGGPLRLSDLAKAEQVRPATMTRLVQELETDGLVTRKQDQRDRRVAIILATPKGIRRLQQGRSRRVSLLETLLDALSQDELKTLREAVQIMEQFVRSDPES